MFFFKIKKFMVWLYICSGVRERSDSSYCIYILEREMYKESDIGNGNGFCVF